MMPEKEKEGSKAKVALVAVLAAVLGGLWAQPFLVSQGKPSEISPEPVRRPRRPPAANSRPASETIKRQPLAFKIEEVVAHDPFLVPNDFRATITESTETPEDQQQQQETDLAAVRKRDRIEKQRAFLKRVKEQGISMIIETDQGRAALVGGEVLREGDILDGYTVERITTDGIVLARDKSDD